MLWWEAALLESGTRMVRAAVVFIDVRERGCKRDSQREFALRAAQARLKGAKRPVSDERTLNIGLMGLGVVGSGVLRIIREKARVLARETDRSLRVKKILVRETLMLV